MSTVYVYFYRTIVYMYNKNSSKFEIYDPEYMTFYVFVIEMRFK